VDIFNNKGTPVIAMAQGTVVGTRYEDRTKCGKKVEVAYKASDGTKYVMRYCHLDSVLVSKGDVVEQCQKIGTMGNTGNAKGGANHLHFEIHPNGGAPVSPVPVLEKMAGAQKNRVQCGVVYATAQEARAAQATKTRVA